MPIESKRRNVLKSIGAIGVIGSIAGCTGTGGGGQSNQTPEPTTTEESSDGGGGGSEETESDPTEEWRKKAMREAEKELDGSELLITTAHQEIQDKWTTTDYSAISDVYAPLVDKINVQIAGDDDTTTKYARANQVGGAGFDLINMGGMFELLPDDNVEFGDLSDVPGVKSLPDQAIIGPTVAAWIDVGGPVYNEETVDSPPEAFDDLLAPEFADGQIVIDFTPPITYIGAYIEQKSEGYIRDIADQKPSFEKILPNATKKCANGEAKVSFVNLATHTFGHIEDGQPLKPTSPDMWFSRPKPVVLSAFSEHPWAAKLWVDYLHRPDNERWLIEDQFGMVSARGNESFPEGVAPLASEQMYSPLGFELGPSELLVRFQELIGAPV